MAAILNVLKYIPVSTARKALEKVNPGFKNYFAKSAAYGLDINRAMDFLSDRFQSDAQKAHKAHLEQGEANKTLRPDEAASKAQISNAEAPLRGLKTAASFIGGGLLGMEGKEKAPEAPPSDIQGGEMGPFQGQMGPMQGFMGPEEQGPQQGQMGPLRQGREKPSLKQNLMQNLTPMQKEAGVIPKTREEAIKQYNDIQKRKKEYLKLHEEFGDYYGGQQGQGTGAKSELAALTQQGLSLLQQLNRGK